MHATAPAPDFPAQLPFTNLLRLQDDALQTIHTIMRHLAEDLTTPRARGEDEDDTPQLKTATQRIRLCLQAARELLRFNPPGEVSPPSPRSGGRAFRSESHEGRKSPSDAQHPSNQSSEGRMRVHSSPLDTPRTHPPQPATTLLAAAGRALGSEQRTRAGSEVDTQSVSPSSRFGERISPSRDSSLVAHTSASPDSRLSTHDSAPAASAPPSVPPAVKTPASSSAPTTAPSSVSSVTSVVKTPVSSLPPRPKYFTPDEFNQIMAIMGSEHDLLTPALYARIQEWNAYAIPANLSPAFGITEERLEARKPHEPDR